MCWEWTWPTNFGWRSKADRKAHYDPGEDVYLSQIFGSITTLEVYYDDLDEISGHSGLGTVYSNWLDGTVGSDYYSEASKDCST